jgi:hypothetical protein
VSSDSDDIETFEFTIHRTELIPGGNGALIGYSDDFPDKQFLIVPKDDARYCNWCGSAFPAEHRCGRTTR